MKKSIGTALITGAAQRIGRVIALKLAANGYDIALHYNGSKGAAQKTKRDIQKIGRQCKLFCCNLLVEKDVLSLINLVKKNFTNLNVLINNASIFKKSKFSIADLKIFNQHMSINLIAPYILISEFAKRCKKGNIINILDTHIVKTKTSHVAYLLSKKSLAELTQIAAIDFAPNIRVNAIAPGLILPPERQSNNYLNRLAKDIPLKKKGNPEHVSKAVTFLLDHDYLTGQVIYTDGGEHLI